MIRKKLNSFQSSLDLLFMLSQYKRGGLMRVDNSQKLKSITTLYTTNTTKLEDKKEGSLSIFITPLKESKYNILKNHQLLYGKGYL